MLSTVFSDRHIPSIYKSFTDLAQRGDIISYDGFHIASTKKLYKAIINTKNLDKDKINLFVTLFSIYTGLDPKQLKHKIAQHTGRVTLSFSIDANKAKHLRSLGHQLLKLKVFRRYETADKRIILQGLDILESGETRTYPYNDLLTPIIGYVHKYEEDDYTRVNGIKGIEKSYDTLLEKRQDGIKRGLRDVNNYIILNKQSTIIPTQNGPTLRLNIPTALQRRVEDILTKAKTRFEAQEVMCAVMQSDTGKILTLATSNRFDPKEIRKKDYPSLNANVIEYRFEPGSVLKPLIFAKLLQEKKVNPFDIVKTYNGRFKMGNQVITDDHAYAYLSAENVIVHSSNIGMAQLAQKLGAIEFYQALIDYGFNRPSGIDLPYERVGHIPSITELNSRVYKATTSYGYGLSVNFMQLLKVYNIFNNNGDMPTPRIISSLIRHNKEYQLSTIPTEHILSSATATRVKKILIKTVKEGTGTAAQYQGLEIGGKTGTAHIAEKGHYINQYNSSFFGFVNDNKAHKYTIGVTVIRPNKHLYYASTSAVPVFKQLTDLLVEFNYLEPLK